MKVIGYLLKELGEGILISKRPKRYKTDDALEWSPYSPDWVCNIRLQFTVIEQFGLRQIGIDLGELEASYDESDKLAFRLESTYVNVLLELTDLTNLQQIALKSQGSISDSTFQLALDISQPILAGTVDVNGVKYVLNMEPNTGALVIPEICEIEYALTNDNSVAKISIDSPIFTSGSTVSLSDYSCMTELTTASYKAMLQTDDLNFSLLRTKVKS